MVLYLLVNFHRNGLLAELNLLEQQVFPLINFLKIFSPIIVLDDERTVTRNLKPQVGASEAEGISIHF